MRERFPRVVLVDDSADLRDVVRSCLEREGIEVVAEAADSAGALAAVERLLPDVVVLDVGIPGAPVQSVIAQIVAGASAARVVVFSGWPQAELTGLGVRVVSKSEPLPVLAAAVHRAARESGQRG